MPCCISIGRTTSVRKTDDYQPSKDTMNHVHEVLQLMSVVTDDSRFEEAQNYVKRSGSNMCEVLDAIENRGIEKGIEKGSEKGSEKRQLTTVTKNLSRYIRRSLPIDAQVLEDIAEDNELTVEKVRAIAKENGISLSLAVKNGRLRIEACLSCYFISCQLPVFLS